MIDNIEEYVYDIVKHNSWVYLCGNPPKLKPETNFQVDLELEDADAEMLMDAFFKELKIDRGKFNIETYYPPELYEIDWHPFRKKRGKLITSYLTIDMLIKSAKRGKWLYDEKGMSILKDKVSIDDNIKKSIYHLVGFYYICGIFGKAPLLNNETDLYNDLKLKINDVAELMNTFFKELKVDKGKFSIKTYYPSEDNVSFFDRLNPFKKVKTPKVPAFTIGMLIESAKRGIWLYDEKGEKIIEDK